MERAAGILLPVFALPSEEGIGTLGAGAREFADFLQRGGQSWWQVLPVCPTGGGNSPYSAVSSSAGNPLLIDLASLAEDGLLTKHELASAGESGDRARIDYRAVAERKLPLLRAACARGARRDRKQVAAFARERETWLPDYTLFQAARQYFSMLPWTQWPDLSLRRRDPDAMKRYRTALADEIEFQTYLQYLFFRQWDEMKRYVNEKGIRILGDLPIYVALDSADVWASRENFQMDGEGCPTAVAGVPPDRFSEDGQLWGNPLYDWEHMRQDGFGWWIRRIDGAARLFDAIRIDHFRGLESYWSVPAGAASAREGAWRKGPGMALLGVLTGWFPGTQLIAEDLGVLTPEVYALLRESGLPGMRVLEFAFDGGSGNPYLPHNYESHSLCCTGTHDNAPLRGWWETLPETEQAAAAAYLGVERDRVLPALIRAGMGSVAELFMAQMQDWLGLGNEARTNVPGVAEGNWRWRMTWEELHGADSAALRRLTELYGRCPAQ